MAATPADFMRDAHHWLILHGRYVCKARRPDCPRCPVSRWCEYADKRADMTFFANQNREALREAWRVAWQRHRDGLPLEPLQAQIADVIAAHPEYQAFVASETSAQADFLPEGGRENPFLHMGLHLALREQLGTDRPRGIRAVHQQLVLVVVRPTRPNIA